MPRYYSNMGQFIAEIGQLSAAIDSFKQALKIKPDYAEAYANFSLPHLLQGSLEEGLKLYEWRLRKMPGPSPLLGSTVFGMVSRA